MTPTPLQRFGAELERQRPALLQFQISEKAAAAFSASGLPGLIYLHTRRVGTDQWHEQIVLTEMLRVMAELGAMHEWVAAMFDVAMDPAAAKERTLGAIALAIVEEHVTAHSR
jgi:hypothetical protein